ncbi:hypothetical protein [Streptomyces sp. NPDC003327]
MRTKTSSALLAASLVVGSVLAGAPAASANTYCSSSGYTGSNTPRERCTSLSNGVLTHWQRLSLPYTKWDTKYYKSGGSAVSVRLGYSTRGATTYSTAFTISAGQTVTRTWQQIGDYTCYSSVGILTYSGGTFQTPAATC